MYMLLAKFAPLGVIIQFLLIIHAYRTGRPWWWMWVIMGMPYIGSLAYLLVEILPEIRQDSQGGSWFSLLPRSLRIKLLRERVEECDTVQNREILSNELRSARQFDAALEVMREALQGVFRNDPNVLYDVAMIQIDRGEFAEALALLERAAPEAEKQLMGQLKVARAHCLVELGCHEEASAILGPMENLWSGEQVHYLLAIIDIRDGRQERGAARLTSLCKHYRKGYRGWRVTEKRWYQLAKAELARLKAAAA